MSIKNTIFNAVATQLESFSAYDLKVMADKATTKKVGSETAWFFPAMCNDVVVEVLVYPRNDSFMFSLIGRGHNGDDAVTAEKELEAKTFADTLHSLVGGRVGSSKTRQIVDNQFGDFRKLAKTRNSKAADELRETLTNALLEDLGHGPSIVDSWLMDGNKDDFLDFVFVVKGIYGQRLDFDIQLTLSFSPNPEYDEKKTWGVSTQYIRNYDGYIFVNDGDVEPSTFDPLYNLRDYLTAVVETGNKKVEKWNKELEETP